LLPRVVGIDVNGGTDASDHQPLRVELRD